MAGVLNLLKNNRNYRNTWLAQVVSEVGDYFNNIAVFSLVLDTSGSGMVVSGVMLARAIPATLAGPLAGVVLDRYDRRLVMVLSDVIRAVVALAFLFTIHNPHRNGWLYALSAILMFASPFFTSGRSAILPNIVSAEELHAANSLTQTTGWATLTIGTMLAGFSTAQFGYHWAFIINALSFVFSGIAIWQINVPQTHLEKKRGGGGMLQGFHEYREGLRYLKSIPLLFGIGMISVGWASGGGAAQILFALFGEQVFHRGPAGIGTIWGFAGIGLLIGGFLGHYIGGKAGFAGYKKAVAISYIGHGATYVAFSLMTNYQLALFMVLLSRVGMSVSSVLNNVQLLRHTADDYRGRVFATMETLRWSVMMFSMAAAGIASSHFSPREIGVAAGILSSLTAFYWAWADFTGRLPEPELPSK